MQNQSHKQWPKHEIFKLIGFYINPDADHTVWSGRPHIQHHSMPRSLQLCSNRGNDRGNLQAFEALQALLLYAGDP